jgi:hypothetical protein
MNLYMISQRENNDYDTYDSAVVAAPDEETARLMNPANGDLISDWGHNYSTWCSSPDLVCVELLGIAKPGTKTGVIVSSFNAG